MLPILLALALAAPGEKDCLRVGERCDPNSGRGISQPWFQAFPASGAGLPYAQGLCDQLTSAEKVGAGWCINGDATTATGFAPDLNYEADGGYPTDGGNLLSDGGVFDAGIVIMAAAGSPLPTTSVDAVCPNGPSCSTLTSQRLTTGGYFTTPNSPVAPTAFTGCIDFSPDSLTNINFFGKIAGATPSTDMQWYIQRQTSGAVTGAVFKAGGAGTSATAPAGVAMVIGGHHVACLRYQYVSDGASKVQVCLDGTCGTEGTTAVGPLSPVVRGTRIGFDSSAVYVGRVFGAFQTMTDLGTSRIAAISHAVLADRPTGAKGEALSETRTNVQGCINEDAGVGSIVPANRLCVMQGGTTAAQGAFDQKTIRTEEPNNASWTKVGTYILTADKWVSPVGTLSADRLWVAACPTVGTFNGAFISAANTTNQTVSAFFRGCISISDGGCATEQLTAAGDGGMLYPDGGPAVGLDGGSGRGSIGIYSYSTTGTTGTAKACSYTADAWSRCSLTTALASGSEMGVGCVNLATLTGSSDTGVADVLVWGANDTNTSARRPYVPATTAAVTTGAETPYFTLTNAPALNSIHLTFDAPSAYSGSAPYLASVYKDANNRTEMYIDTSSSNKLTCAFVVGGVSYPGLSSAGVSTSATHTVSCSYDGTNVIACVDGTCNSTARSFTQITSATRFYIGAYSGGTAQMGPQPVIKYVAADPSPTRFR